MTRPLHLAISYDEEVGCLGAPSMIAEIAREVPSPAAVVVGEPTDMVVVSFGLMMADLGEIPESPAVWPDSPSGTGLRLPTSVRRAPPLSLTKLNRRNDPFPPPKQAGKVAQMTTLLPPFLQETPPPRPE